MEDPKPAADLATAVLSVTADETSHSSADVIIYVCITAMVILAILSFYFSPVYEKGVWLVFGVIQSALSGALGFKFGVTNSNNVTKGK